jgi:3-oxoacyl-[acyl-carrier protein] reductase
MIGLADRTAIVTGGGTGIGQAIALALAKEGTRVVVCGRRAEPLEKTAEAIEEIGGAGLAVQSDVSNSEDVTRLVKSTVDEYGSVGILVNNAGVGGGGYIHEHDIEQWDRVMAINLRGPFLTARAVLLLMRNQRQGHIINISSESGLEYYQGNGAYGVAKHALNALGEFIQRENQELGIRVDTICPGMVVTEMTQTIVGIDRSKSLYPDDIAHLVIWLLSRRPNIKIGRPVLIQTMENPWL